jgi:hypothetical protein
MASKIHNRDINPTLDAADKWINECLVEDGSLFSEDSLWTSLLVDEVHHAFVDHPDLGKDDFMTKLKGQMDAASPRAQELMAEMLWALLLFPSNMKARTESATLRPSKGRPPKRAELLRAFVRSSPCRRLDDERRALEIEAGLSLKPFRKSASCIGGGSKPKPFDLQDRWGRFAQSEPSFCVTQKHGEEAEVHAAQWSCPRRSPVGSSA